MSAHQPTRGCGSSSKLRGRSSSSSRDETRDQEMDTSSGDEVVRLGNMPDAIGEEDESPIDSNDRRVKRESNEGTRLLNSPEQRRTIVVRTPESFDNPSTTREITCIVKGYTHGVYMCYPDVPKHLDDKMFKAFGEKFKWPNHEDDEVHKVFRTIASRQLRDRAKRYSNSENLLDVKGHVYSLGSSQVAVERKKSSRRSTVRSQIEALKKQLAEANEKWREDVELRRIEIENLMASIDALIEAKIKEMLSQLNLPNSIFPSSSGTKP